MKILVTGSKGFIGRNLIKVLKKYNYEIIEYDIENTMGELKEYCKDCDAVFHLAAVLRPENISGFDNNIDLTSCLLKFLDENEKNCSIMFSSSIQADLDNPYGECKRIEEKKIIEYGNNNRNTYIFRFPNLFGTMSRPNYTSVISTFCYNTVKGLPIVVNDPSTQIKFAFVEDVMEYVSDVVLSNLQDKVNKINMIEKYYLVGLGELSYYMETIKLNIEPKIRRNDDFYDKLKYTYNWYKDNIFLFD